MVTTKQKKDDYADLIAVGLIALVALLNQEGGTGSIEKTTNSFFYSLIFVLIISVFIIAGVSIFISKKFRSSRLKLMPEAIASIKLNWGQELQHNLVLYFLPIIILLLPIFSNLSPDFTDFLQATVAFLTVSYLKKLYWGKFF